MFKNKKYLNCQIVNKSSHTMGLFYKLKDEFAKTSFILNSFIVPSGCMKEYCPVAAIFHSWSKMHRKISEHSHLEFNLIHQ